MNRDVSNVFSLRSVFSVAFLMSATGITVFLSYKFNAEVLLFVLPILFLAFYIVIKFPEIFFALFLTAGAYKADPRLSMVPGFLDLTVTFGLLSLIGITYGIVMKRFRFIIPSKHVLVPYIIIVTMGLLSLTYTIAPIYGIDKLLRFLTITSMALFMPFFLFQRKDSIIRFFIMLIALSLLMILDIMSSGLTPEEIGFHSALGSTYLAMGRTVGTALIILFFYFLMSAHSNIVRLLYFLLIPIMVFSMLISGGRGPVIALAVSILVIFIYLTSMLGKKMIVFSKLEKKYFKVLFISIMLIIISVSLIINFSEYFSTFFMRMEVLQEGGGSTSERVDRFKKAVDAIISFPTFLTGLGIGGFSVFYESVDDKRGQYPHNIFLELGSELGILGLIAITLLIFGSFYTVIFSIKNAPPNDIFLTITFLAILTFMVFNSSKSGDINDNRFLFTCFGLIYSYKQSIITGFHKVKGLA